jgi:predicted SprT family Zn-dependent metalloprotease
LSYFDIYDARYEASKLVRETLDKLDANNSDLTVIVEFNGRFTARMGDARVRDTGHQAGCHFTGRIRLSKPLWPRATPEERRSTTIHETCHIVQRYRELKAGRPRSDAHGFVWKALMIECGLTPKRCHKVNRDGLKRTVARVQAYCGCDEGHQITKTRRTKMRRGKLYTCKRCRHSLRLYQKQGPWGMPV